ncbi:LuxR family transcriptional regulator, partial [Nitratireductor pacificus pht-3B]
MSFNGDDIGRALDACYDAVVLPDDWPLALQALSRSVGASAAMFFPKDVNENAAHMPASPDYVEFLEHYVRGGWYAGHYRSERGWPMLEKSPTAVVLEHDLATDEERRRLPHYNDLYLRWGYKGFAAIGFQIDGEPWCVPLLRSVRQGFFEREEAGTLARLSHHFSRIARLNRRFVVARNATGLEALDRIDRAALLLDHNGRVIEMNGRAEDLLSRCRGVLVIRNGRLGALQPDSDRRLQALA